MLEFNRTGLQQFRTTILNIHNHSIQHSKLKFISPDKWKNLMIKSLKLISEFNYADPDLIHDLGVIVNNISEDKFIQAILSFQPFKPKFKHVNFLELDFNSSKIQQNSVLNQSSYGYQTPKTKLKKDSSIIQKGSVILKKKNSIKKQPQTCDSIKNTIFQSQSHQKQSFLQEYLQVIIQQQTLRRQFQKKYHPFKKIIDSFTFILENKYKNIIEKVKNIKLEKIQQMITYDVLVLEKMFVKISQPYQTIFYSENFQEVKLFKLKIQNFMKDYVHSHEKINSAIRKIMRYYSKNSKSIKKLQESIQDFVQITNFQIPDDFKIDGSYVRSMNSLMEFAQITQASQALKKLHEFRMTIAKDVDEYYNSIKQDKERQINAEVQIQIIRFIVCKLKGWIPEIFAQLKYLQIVYGDQQIAFKYDDASYIYAQLITVFDALQVQASSQTDSCIYESKLSSSQIKI